MQQYTFFMFSSLIVFESNLVPPVPPIGLEVVHITRTSAKAKWKLLPIVQPFGIITGYALRIKEHTPFVGLNDTYELSNQERKYQFSNLLPSSKYSVQLAVITAAGIGVFTKPVIFLTEGSK